MIGRSGHRERACMTPPIAPGQRSSRASARNILLEPDIEAGNMVAKQLTYLAGADSAGILVLKSNALEPHFMHTRLVIFRCQPHIK